MHHWMQQHRARFEARLLSGLGDAERGNCWRCWTGLLAVDDAG